MASSKTSVHFLRLFPHEALAILLTGLALLGWMGWEYTRKTAVSEELRRPALSPARLDFRHATLWELQELPGIGPSRAREILRLRDSGEAHSLVDLRERAGLPDDVIEHLRPHLLFGDEH